MTRIFLLVHESDVVKTLIHFVEKQYVKTVRLIRIDNAKELCEGELRLFYLQKGIFN